MRKLTARDLKIRQMTKQKSVWLKTPHEAPFHAEDYSIVYDENGVPVFTPVIHGVTQATAIDLIKKGAGEVEVDPDTQEITQVLLYSIATEEEVKVHLEQKRRYRLHRQTKIHTRAMKEAKHIVRVDAKDVNPISPEDLKPAAPPEPEPDKAPTYEELMRSADALGIEYKKNLGVKKLLLLIADHRSKEK